MKHVIKNLKSDFIMINKKTEKKYLTSNKVVFRAFKPCVEAYLKDCPKHNDK